MYGYRLTNEDALTMFFNSIFLGDKLKYNSTVLEGMARDIDLAVGDVKKILGETRQEILISGYTSPDGKVIVLDKGYCFDQVQKFYRSTFKLVKS